MTYSPPNRAQRRAMRFLDALSARPGAAVVFALSVVALLSLGALQRARGTSARAVVHAAPVALSTTTTTTVQAHHVTLGQRVAAGDLLVTLDTTATNAAIAEVENQLRSLEAQMALERTQLSFTNQRSQIQWLQARQSIEYALQTSQARTQGSRLALGAARGWRDNVKTLVEQGVEPRSALLEAEKELADANAAAQEARASARTSQRQAQALDQTLGGDLPSDRLLTQLDALAKAEHRRLTAQLEHLKATRDAALLRAPHEGTVAFLAPIGSRADMSAAVARVMPVESTTLVAHLPVTTPARDLPRPGQKVALGLLCPQGGEIVRLGAAVEAAPDQLNGPLPGQIVHGLPVFVTLSPECPMTPGMVVSIEIQP